MASSDLGYNLPQSHLPPKLAKRLTREAGTLRSRERSLSWEMGRRSEGGKVSIAPRESNQPATIPFSKLGRPAAFRGCCCMGGRQRYLGPGCLPDPGLPYPANVLLTQASAKPILMKHLGPKTPTWPLQEKWILVRSGVHGICVALLETPPPGSFYTLKPPPASPPWRHLSRLLPTSGAQAPGPHKANRQSVPAVQRSPAVSPPPPATSPGGEGEGLLG